MPTGNVPSQLDQVYCNDEELLVAASGDFWNLCPSWQKVAFGTDGYFNADDQWTLNSTAIDFAAQGVQPNYVVMLSQGSGIGDFLAVDSVTGNSIVLRRPYMNLYAGQPYAPAVGLSGVKFEIRTLSPQIEEASYELNRRFTIDPVIFYRSPERIYDLRDLRMATVWTVLYNRYNQENRTNDGDFEKKTRHAGRQLATVMERVQVRWGPMGASTEPTTLFNMKIST